MKKLVVLFLLLVVALNPISAQTKQEKKAAKAETAEKEYQAMKTLVNSGDFEFIGEWANSQRGKRINLMSNPTSIKMEGKEADGYLPFFGTSQSASYGSGSGIEFKGTVEDYTLKFDDKKQKAIIKFKAKGDNVETFDVGINVFGSLNTTVNINSSNRSPMSYNGKIKKLEKKEK